MFRFLRKILLAVIVVVVTYLGLCTALLLLYTQVNPPITGVQLQRQVEAWLDGEAYERRYRPVSRSEMSRHLRHAVVAAEDTRFYEHNGIDWEAVQQAVDEAQEGGRLRGGSTITQQLVKNLFMTTHRSWVRKAFEVPLTYLTELILSKERILDLYLNVIEWADGVYGAQAAATRYYSTSASHLSRYQSAALAAVIPDPLRRSPQSMGGYTSTILQRMAIMGW